jgi:Flp pilus assembly protein TadG
VIGKLRRTTGRRRERGAALTEFAIILPVIAVLLCGLVEFGFAWQDKMTVESAVRAGARTGSSLGTQRLTDYSIIEGVKSALNDIGITNVQYVVVYKSSTVDGAVPAACSGSAPTSQSGICNVYTGAQLQTLTQASFTSTGTAPNETCASSAPDRFWCPTSREDIQSAGTDFVGVWVKASHPTVTKFFGSSITMTASAVMRIEPNEGTT